MRIQGDEILSGSYTCYLVFSTYTEETAFTLLQNLPGDDQSYGICAATVRRSQRTLAPFLSQPKATRYHAFQGLSVKHTDEKATYYGVNHRQFSDWPFLVLLSFDAAFQHRPPGDHRVSLPASCPVRCRACSFCSILEQAQTPMTKNPKDPFATEPIYAAIHAIVSSHAHPPYDLHLTALLRFHGPADSGANQDINVKDYSALQGASYGVVGMSNFIMQIYQLYQ